MASIPSTPEDHTVLLDDVTPTTPQNTVQEEVSEVELFSDHETPSCNYDYEDSFEEKENSDDGTGILPYDFFEKKKCNGYIWHADQLQQPRIIVSYTQESSQKEHRVFDLQ